MQTVVTNGFRYPFEGISGNPCLKLKTAVRYRNFWKGLIIPVSFNSLVVSHPSSIQLIIPSEMNSCTLSP